MNKLIFLILYFASSLVFADGYVKLPLSSSIIDNNPDLYSVYHTDFVGYIGQFNAATSGTSSACQNDSSGVDSTSNVIGSFKCQTGTDTTGRGHIYLNVDGFRTGGQTIDAGWRIKLDALSDDTDTYTSVIGFIDTVTSVTMTNGAYFKYTNGTNSGKWQCIVAKASTETAYDCGLTADTSYHVFVIKINGAGTQFDFYIDGVLKKSVTDSSKYPTSSVAFGFGAGLKKSAGTNNVNMHYDWAYVKMTRSTSR